MWPSGIDWIILVGSTMFTVALIPQAVRTIRLGRANDMSLPFILLVLGASILTLTYWLIRGEPWLVYYGFIANILVWGIVGWYRIFPRRSTTSPKTS